MKRGIWGGFAVATAVVLPLLTVCGLLWLHGELFPPALDPCRLPGPILAASAGDGEVTLSWKLADSQESMIKGWQYLQSAQGGSSLVTPDIGPAAASYAVTDLMNGVTYSFQLRAIRKSGGFGRWSASVPARPGHLGDLVKRMEKHQKEIAASASQLVERAAGIRDEVTQLAGSVNAAGQKIADGLAGISVQLCEKAPGEQVDCPVTSVRPDSCEPPDSCESPDPCNRTLLGYVHFENNSHQIGGYAKNEEALNKIVTGLQKAHLNSGHKGGLVLTEGYATAVGYAMHNLSLSDRRAACVSRCLHDRLVHLGLEDGQFEFREIAKGEALDRSDPAGTSPKSRRVNVFLCSEHSPGGANAEKWPLAWPVDCSCPEKPL